MCRVGLTPGIVTKYHIAMTIIREEGDATWPRTQTLPALIRQDRGHVLYRAHIVLVGTPISKLLDRICQLRARTLSLFFQLNVDGGDQILLNNPCKKYRLDVFFHLGL